MPKPRLPKSHPTLFEEAGAQLPLFDDLPEAAIERLASDGYGRGLLTASLRARLRKAGFADRGALARAAPAALMAVRKVGPLRVAAIREHLRGELARLVSGARAFHERDATERRRMERLRAVPVADLPLDASLRERIGAAGTTAADLAARRRGEIGPALGLTPPDLDRIVAALAQVLRPPPPAVEPAPEAPPAQDRAALLRERDREWDEAAPGRDE